MNLLRILVIFCLLIFPFGELLRFDSGNNIVIKPLDLLIGTTVLWWLILKIKNSKFKVKNYSFAKFSTGSAKLKAIKNNKLALLLIFFISIGLLSLLLNLTWLKIDEFFVSLLYLIRWTAYASIFFVIIQFDKQFKEKIKLLLLIDGLIIVLIGFLQYLFYNNLRNLYYLGWDMHMHRIFSIFFDPNFAGAFFVLYFILIAGLAIEYLKKGKKKIFVILCIILIMTLISIFLTFSRSAILMFIAGTITLLVFINKKRLILILFFALLLFVIIVSPKFYDENMNLFRFNSSEARIANDLVAWKIFQDHPIIGVGFNSYRYTKELYKMNHDWTNAPSHADAGVDNSFLFVLATTGLIGGIGYAGLWVNILKRASSRYKKNKNILALIIVSSSIGLFVNALFINSLFFAPIMLWIWILIGLMWKD